MAKAVDVHEYLDNMTQLLRQEPAFYGLLVERQVQARLLPRVAGPRVTLEPDLWRLFIFCLEGPEADVPGLDDSAFERAQGAAHAGARLSGDGAAAYPQAARAVLRTMDTLREVGIYPPPKL